MLPLMLIRLNFIASFEPKDKHYTFLYNLIAISHAINYRISFKYSVNGQIKIWKIRYKNIWHLTYSCVLLNREVGTPVWAKFKCKITWNSTEKSRYSLQYPTYNAFCSDFIDNRVLWIYTCPRYPKNNNRYKLGDSFHENPTLLGLWFYS